MSTIGAAGEVVARMSKPPPNAFRLFAAPTNDPVVVAPTTSVNTTSVNIARVTPVRKRLRSGYAIAMRRTGARLLIRPNVDPSAPSRTSALYISVQVAPITIISPPSRKIEKSTLSSPKSQRWTGSTNHAISASPAPVRTARSCRPSARRIGTRPRTASETPSPSGAAFLLPTPLAISRTPSAIDTAPSSQRRRRCFSCGGSARLRIALTMFIRLTRQAENATTASVSRTPTV